MRSCASTLVSFILVTLPLVTIQQQRFTLKIIHFNDLHSQFDEITNRSKPCNTTKDACVAGVARLAHTVNKLRNENANHLVLNAGDVFQGSIWYSQLKWNVCSEFMNMIQADAMVLGNHEFDDQIEGVLPFLEATKKVTPVVLSNLNMPKIESDSAEKLKASINSNPLVINKGGKQIGIIGVIYEQTNKIANTAPVTFKPSMESVAKQARNLKQKGVNIIIVLSHCGIYEDIRIAQHAGDDIDIIVGGHSHTLLYNENPPTDHKVFGDYPLLVNSTNGRQVLIVQALCHGLYVGNISLTFDEEGEVISHSGRPIYQGPYSEKDKAVDARVQQVRKVIEERSSVVVGTSEVLLDNDCYGKECKLGGALTDAYVWHLKDDSPETFAICHPGNFRIALDPGSITMGEVLTAMPFSSKACKVKLSGRTLKLAFEKGAQLSPRCKFNILQVSDGVKVVVDFGAPIGSRVTIQVKTGNRYEDLDLAKEYTVIANSYMLKGGDGFEMFNGTSIEKWGSVDAEVFAEYAKGSDGLTKAKMNSARITILNSSKAEEYIEKCNDARRK